MLFVGVTFRVTYITEALEGRFYADHRKTRQKGYADLRE